MSETLQRIAADLEHVKRRAVEMLAGSRGVIPAEHRHVGAGQAFDAQLKALEARREQLERDYVFGMISEQRWSSRDVIDRMERPAPISQ